MVRLYSDWLEENGVCSSEFKKQSLKDEFVIECTKNNVNYEMDIHEDYDSGMNWYNSQQNETFVQS